MRRHGQDAQLGLELPPPPRRKRRKRRGRPRNFARVPHGRREVQATRPLHVTLRVRPEVWNLRSRRCFGVLRRAFYKCLSEKHSRVAHFSVQGNHVHLLVEARDSGELGAMMRAMCVRMAKGLNKVMGRRAGKVFGDRYHSRSLRSPTETRAALVYVLQNRRGHLAELGERLPRDWTDDDYSSARWFPGWKEARPSPPTDDPALVAPPVTWLLDKGWRLRGGGPISRNEVPASKTRASRNGVRRRSGRC